MHMSVFTSHKLMEPLINSAPSSWRIFFARFSLANPLHSLGYASGLLPQSDEKICVNRTDFILSAIPYKTNLNVCIDMNVM